MKIFHLITNECVPFDSGNRCVRAPLHVPNEYVSEVLLEVNSMSCTIFLLEDFKYDLLTASTFHSFHLLKAFSIDNIHVHKFFVPELLNIL